jgi:hypothetical protein
VAYVPSLVNLENVMAHFYMYGDESGKLAQSEFTSFCGYVGHTTEFERTMMEWNNCRFGWGVPPLHMRLAMNPEWDKSGEWQKVKAEWGGLLGNKARFHVKGLRFGHSRH